MEYLGESAWLEELGHWGLALSVYSLTPLSAHPLFVFPVGGVISQLLAQATRCHTLPRVPHYRL